MDYNGFFDLNVSANAFKDTERLFKRLIDFGYRTVAINHVIEESVLQSKPDKKRKGSGNNVAVNTEIVCLPNVIELPQDLKGKLKVLNRLTVEFSDTNQLVKLRQSENIKKYHLLAFVPKNETAFQRAIMSYDFDIVSFLPLEKPVRLSRKMYNLAISKHICFEIPYSPMFFSSTARKNTIQTAHEYHAMGRCKNVILTSWAENHLHLRGPYDVANLGLLFGLSMEQSKRAIMSLSRQAILKGDGRRHGTAAMVIKKVDDQLDADEEMDDLSPVKKRLKDQFSDVNL